VETYSGLTAAEVEARRSAGQTNRPVQVKTRTAGRIVADNLFTYLNLIIFVLAFIAVWVHSTRNALFVFATIFNTAVGIVQEIRVKRAIDRLTVLTANTATVVRDGAERRIPVDEIVLGDLLRLRAGDQVPADAEVLSSEGLAVNEALLTGEADSIYKSPGSEALAGSFATAGAGYARVARVGEASYASQIVSEARKADGGVSPLIRALNQVLKSIGIVLIPLGGLLFLSDYRLVNSSFQSAMSAAVASMVSLVPQGLLVLTNVSLAVGVIKMAKHMAFFKSLPSVEIMARLDVLCFDKTGTLSDGQMRMEGIALLKGFTSKGFTSKGFTSEGFISEGLRALMAATPADNATTLAIKEYLEGAEQPGEEPPRPAAIMPFSSERKWSGATFPARGGGWDTWILGAPEMLATEAPVRDRAAAEAEAGRRVLALCYSAAPPSAETQAPLLLPEGLRPAALVTLSNAIKDGVEEVTQHLQEQGIALKVISGDAAATTAAVAATCGIAGAQRAVDLAETRPGAEGITYATLAEQYDVFGRASPYDKRELIRAMRAAGKSVGMAGDGVNDVLSMKEANLSIAMGAGSEAAKNIAHVILLHSDFASLPAILKEGRNIISNIETVATLYLTKTVYAFILIVLFLFLPLPYPFLPIHATLISTATIGIPSILLAFYGGNKVVGGNFVRDVIVRAIPYGILVAVNILVAHGIGRLFHLTRAEISTLCVMVTAVVAIQVLINVCTPFRAHTRLVVGIVIAIFTLAFAFLQRFFLLWWRPGWPVVAALAFSIVSAVLLRFAHAAWLRNPWRFWKRKRAER